MKKIIALLISAVMLLGLLAGCGNQTEDPAAGGDQTVVPVAVGMLVLNTGAAVNISYDADGLVLNVEGADANGTILAGEYMDYLGKTCSEAVCELIGNSKAMDLLNMDVSYILIKQSFGSALPGSSFLESIAADAENAAKEVSPAKVILMTEENLDEDGYINLESAKELMLSHLVLDSFDTLDGTTVPSEGLYGFAVTAGDMDMKLIVDAVTGSVYEGELEDSFFEEDNLDEVLDETIPEDESVEIEATAPVAADPEEGAGPEDSSSETVE